MSLLKYARPLVLEPASSKKLLYLFLFIHGLAITGLFFPMHLPWYWRILILLAITLSALRLCNTKSLSDIRRACWKTTGGFEIVLCNGKKYAAYLLPGTLVTEWLTVLHLKCEDNKKRYWLLADDMLDADTYRMLSVRLRQHCFDNESEIY